MFTLQVNVLSAMLSTRGLLTLTSRHCWADGFHVLLGPYSDTQPQRYLLKQPREKRKLGCFRCDSHAVAHHEASCLVIFPDLGQGMRASAMSS
jgi:hypothetical protein